jgi:uncharacterized repeat protein (TIGR03803 family)
MARIVLPFRSDRRARRLSYVAAFVVTLAAGVLAPQSAQAQTETVLYSFKNRADGIYPSAGLIRDAAGNLYGTTYYGGAFGAGTVFKLSKHGKTILYSFHGKADGALPSAGLLRDVLGNLYSTTQLGGDLTCDKGLGCGTVFKLSAAGKETVLHSFADSTTDGGYPVAGLIRDAEGNFYGTTPLGGTSNVGTVFKLDTTGKETVLYSFTGSGPDGASPNAGVIRDAAGNLYGTTVGGGPQNAGTVFKLDAAGNETVLYTFTGGNGGTDGKYPIGGLVRDAAGNLYGTTEIGGIVNGGTIFKVDQTGTETVLYRFSTFGDACCPQSTMIRDAAGNLYGAAGGGTSGAGTVFKYDTAGNETVLHTFGETQRDGQNPLGGLALDAAGHIYGTTQQGGASGWGTVFEIVP